jgi:hypothetical protein
VFGCQSYHCDRELPMLRAASQNRRLSWTGVVARRRYKGLLPLGLGGLLRFVAGLVGAQCVQDHQRASQAHAWGPDAVHCDSEQAGEPIDSTKSAK